METNTTPAQQARDTEIATTILSQLPRLWAAMVSGKASATSMGVRIQFKGSRKANLWIIQLGGDDTYLVRLVKRTGGRWNSKRGVVTPVVEKTVYSCDGVYADQLRSTFEDETGLCLSL